MPELIGQLFGKYRIVEMLGRGGMAEVYKAYQINLDRHVALKLMLPHLATEDPDFMVRFEQEAKNVAALRHPHIIQIYDFDVVGDTPYMVMELIEGGTLKAYVEKIIKREGILPLPTALRLIGEVGQALAYAHTHHMIHRDVKPANVMMDNDGRAILTDFGLAKILTAPSQTVTGAVLGTPAYMAPEQGMGQPGDHRADLYSLGVMLYELTSGQLPYQADTPMAVMLKHITEPLPLPRTIRADLPERLEAVILQSLAKSPDDRYPNLEALLHALDTVALSLGLSAQFAPVASPNLTGTALGSGTGPLRTTVTGQTGTAARTAGLSLAQSTLKPPPEPTLPPRAEFVGRETELAFYTNKLAQTHLAIITGMPGVGKTVLAATLAFRIGEPSKIFWHSFHAGEGVNVLLWKVAGFLAWHAQPDLWNMLNAPTSGAQQTTSSNTPPEVLFDYLFQMVRGAGYVLCFDNFHFVDDDPLLGKFMNSLHAALQAGEVDILITSRRLPSFVTLDEYPPLTGLSPDDVRQLLDARQLKLSADLVTTLFDHTEGNAHMVTLAVDSLRRAKDIARDAARLIGRLSESDNVERFLVKEVDENLTDDEREVMRGVAVLLGYPGTREAVAAVLDGASVRRTMNDLVNRYLLSVSEGDYGREYDEHSLVQLFYYDLLARKDRQQMHQRAGEFYETEEPDPLKAARHLFRAGQEERAARRLTADVWDMVNRGLARALRSVLEQFTAKGLEPLTWASVLWAKGQVLTLQGETVAARASYDAGHAALAALPASSAVRDLQARTCRGIAELAQFEAPSEAVAWLKRGLDELGGANPLEEAALYIRLGRVLAHLGQATEATQRLRQGLALLPPEPSRLRISALGNLGNIYCVQGDVENGLEHYRQVLAEAEALNDFWAMGEVWINLGIELRLAGRWAEALEQFEVAYQQAERLGSADQQMRAALSLGNLYLRQGDWDLAQHHLLKSRQLAQTRGWKARQLYVIIALAELYLRREDWAPLEGLWAEALRFSEETGVREPLPELHVQRVAVYLRQNTPAEALTEAEHALALARELNDEVAQGLSLRALGQAHWATGQQAAATTAYQHSLELLTDRDPYEAAHTQLSWGVDHWVSGDSAQTATLLRQALTTFQRLGARRDTERATQLLQRLT